jgi:phosphopantothenoylcysteine synthetase/decarboxylase
MKSSKRKKKSLSDKTVLVCVSGSIAAYRACDLVRNLRQEGASVVCLMTEAAQKFITSLTLRSLSGNPVYTDMFSEPENWEVAHVGLAHRADLILMMPATADLIARLAAGFANDLVTSVALASRAPILIVPAMNDGMYLHAITQENISRLKQIGYHFVAPIEGDLVCGQVGVGHIADNRAILAEIQTLIHA